MLTELLFVPIVLVYLGILCALFVYGMNFIYLTFIALRTGDRQPAATIPETWPMVTVQLPVYNEYYVAGRLIDAAARIDYPADRLEIQVLDDSTDDTSTIVADLVAKWRDKGVDITHVQREGRQGYKAGALRHGLEIARGELIAIFDADFVPTPDFLRAAVPAMVADPGLAFVQARWVTSTGTSRCSRVCRRSPSTGTSASSKPAAGHAATASTSTARQGSGDGAHSSTSGRGRTTR